MPQDRSHMKVENDSVGIAVLLGLDENGTE